MKLSKVDWLIRFEKEFAAESGPTLHDKLLPEVPDTQEAAVKIEAHIYNNDAACMHCASADSSGRLCTRGALLSISFDSAVSLLLRLRSDVILQSKTVDISSISSRNMRQKAFPSANPVSGTL